MTSSLRLFVSVVAAGPGGENGVAAALRCYCGVHDGGVASAADGSRLAAGRSRPGMIIQRVARVFMRVREPVVLTFAAMISEVGDGVGDRRVDGPGPSVFLFEFR